MFEPFINQLKALFLVSAGEPRDRLSLDLFSFNLRTAAASVRAAQVALARARAEQQQDRKRLSQIERSLEDLENRARNALLKGLEPLAREAAEAIALLEDEKTALQAAIQSFERDLSGLTETLHRAQSRLRALKRGERTVVVRDRIQKAQSFGSDTGQSALSRAEDQLEDIQRRQERDRLAEREFKALSAADDPDALIEKLGEAGCGAPVKTSADAVLARLRSDLPLLLQQSS
jgi:phage shock protein A